MTEHKGEMKKMDKGHSNMAKEMKSKGKQGKMSRLARTMRKKQML